MKVLELLPIGNLDDGLLLDLGPALADALHVPCEIVPGRMDPAFAFHRERRQYHSSEILHAMQDIVTPHTWRVLGVAAVDLYIPILTFVFGEAQMGGPCAVVSLNRLRQEFYGLPADRNLLTHRLKKEALHEV
jgi:archaemetzincin